MWGREGRGRNEDIGDETGIPRRPQRNRTDRNRHVYLSRPSVCRTTENLVSDNYNLKPHKYVCIASDQPDTKSNSNPNPNPNPTTKQHAIANIQLNIVACLTYPDIFTRKNVVALSVRL